MGVLRRSYAAQRGNSEAAVRKAIATGRITTLEDGTIDPTLSDSEWGTQTDPAKQRGQTARQMGAETAASPARSAATKPVPQAAIRAVADTLRDGAGWRDGGGEQLDRLLHAPCVKAASGRDRRPGAKRFHAGPGRILRR